jgi:nucleotide-binding universal stress UspA family protein
MLKSIVLCLDVTPCARGAELVALELSRQSGAHLTGVSVVDVPHITAPQAAPIGGSRYKHAKDASLLKEAEAVSERLIGEFDKNCGAFGVPHDGVVVRDDPQQALLRIMQRCDLIVIGRDTTFRGDSPTRLGDVIDSLARDTPRPMVIAPANAPGGSSVIVAYDGSVPAMRALHLYILLGLGTGRVHHVVSVGKKQSDVDETAIHARTFLELHGMRAEPHGIVSKTEPAVTLLNEAERLKAGLLVMGAYGHRGWRDLIWGSCTHTLLERSAVPMFVHH